MLTHDYSYAACLQPAETKPWTVDDCFAGRDFDFTKRFLPERIAGVEPISCLDDDDKRMLNQIRGNSYCHIFAFVEECSVPMVVDHARRDVCGDETHLWSLLRFAEDEGQADGRSRRETSCSAPTSSSPSPGSWPATAASPATPTPRQPRARPCSLGVEDHGERVD